MVKYQYPLRISKELSDRIERIRGKLVCNRGHDGIFTIADMIRLAIIKGLEVLEKEITNA